MLTRAVWSIVVALVLDGWDGGGGGNVGGVEEEKTGRDNQIIELHGVQTNERTNCVCLRTYVPTIPYLSPATDDDAPNLTHLLLPTCVVWVRGNYAVTACHVKSANCFCNNVRESFVYPPYSLLLACTHNKWVKYCFGISGENSQFESMTSPFDNVPCIRYDGIN